MLPSQRILAGMKLRLLPSLVILGALALAPRAARADVPPGNACNTEGSACNTAGTGFNQPGVCTMSTCQHPGPDGSTSYGCLLCLESDSGTAGSGGSGASGGTGGSAGKSGTGGSSGKASSGDSGGCSLAAAPEGSGLAALMLLGGAAALAVSRRRR